MCVQVNESECFRKKSELGQIRLENTEKEKGEKERKYVSEKERENYKLWIKEVRRNMIGLRNI